MADKEGIQEEPQELEKIASWLKSLKFKKKVFGGVDEADVWKKIGQLNEMYEQIHEEERLRYDLLLEERMRANCQRADSKPDPRSGKK